MKNCPKPTLSTAAAPRGKRCALSVACALLLAAAGGNSHAIGFGQLRIHSALGQPLRAEVELLDAGSSPGSVTAGMAPLSAYEQKGIDYNPLVGAIRASVKRSGSRVVVVLSSDRPMNDPFIDVVLQANDGSGAITRDFSMLLDPPQSAPAPAPVLAPRTDSASSSAPPAAVPPEPVRSSAATPEEEDIFALTENAPDAKPAKASKPGKAARRAEAAEDDDGAPARTTLRVQRGETAGAIAAAHKPAGVSLDQMLLAMLRANPNAFINGNVNLIKAGAVLKMPGSAQAQATSAAQARRTISAQSEDFRSYRRNLAQSGTLRSTTAADARKSGGQVQARVQDTRPTPSTSPDTLTLSKGAGVKGSGKAAPTSTEQRIAQAAADKAAASRAEELNRNLEDLRRLSAAASAAPPPAGKAPALPAGVTAPVPAPVTPPAPVKPPEPVKPTEPVAPPEPPAPPPAPEPAPPPVVEPASAAASQAQEVASAPDETASQAAVEGPTPVVETPPAPPPAPEPPKAKTPPPAPPPQPSFMESLSDYMVPLGGGAAVLLALAGLFYMRRKKKGAGNDSAFLESHFTPDSFFNATGGQEINTRDTNSPTDINQSSMLYSPSQLDAEADVDPVSEADVYLAYGRDIQAEEILNDALEKNPSRPAIYAKLLEIYARRRDAKAYGQKAAELKRLTGGVGPDWEVAVRAGAELDPSNPLFAQAAAAAGVPLIPRAAAPAAAAASTAGAFAAPPKAAAAPRPAAQDDMALFASGSATSPSKKPAAPQASPQDELMDALSAHDLPPLSMPDSDDNAMLSLPDLGEALSHTSSAPPPAAPPALPSSNALALDDIDLNLDLDAAPSAAPPAAPAPMHAAEEDHSLDFDMSALASTAEQAPAAQPAGNTDAMSTKLALANEFLNIGDKDGARALAQEVAEKAIGPAQQQAKEFLRSLG